MFITCFTSWISLENLCPTWIRVVVDLLVRCNMDSEILRNRRHVPLYFSLNAEVIFCIQSICRLRDKDFFPSGIESGFEMVSEFSTYWEE